MLFSEAPFRSQLPDTAPEPYVRSCQTWFFIQTDIEDLVFDQLLGQCAGTLIKVTGLETVGEGTHDTLDIDTVMLPETFIFNRNEGIYKCFRYIIVVNILTVGIKARKDHKLFAVLIIQGCLISFRDQILGIHLWCVVQYAF